MKDVVTIVKIFDMVKEAKSKKEKLEILSNYRTYGVLSLLQLNYRKDIILQVPHGIPPVPVGTDVLYPDNLERLTKELESYTNPAARKDKLELAWSKLFIRINEKEAELLVECHAKELELGVSYEDLVSLWPEHFPKGEERESSDKKVDEKKKVAKSSEKTPVTKSKK